MLCCLASPARLDAERSAWVGTPVPAAEAALAVPPCAAELQYSLCSPLAGTTAPHTAAPSQGCRLLPRSGLGAYCLCQRLCHLLHPAPLYVPIRELCANLLPAPQGQTQPQFEWSKHCLRAEKSVRSRARHPLALVLRWSLSCPCWFPGCPLPHRASFLLVPSACTALLCRWGELLHVQWLCAMLVSAVLSPVHATPVQVTAGLQLPWEQTP